MKRLLLPLLAALALPTTANATNYVECEAIYSLIARTKIQKNEDWGRLYQRGEKDKYDGTIYDKVIERASRDYDKRGCLGFSETPYP